MLTFLLGAGFNADAAAEVGPIFGTSLYIGRHRIDTGYPMVGETLRLCFGLDQQPLNRSIEDLFSDAFKRGDYGPLRKLADRLSHADYHIATSLARDTNVNCYRRFFEAFPDCDLLTFNYDSLPETLLFRLERWYPHDGYGLPVHVRLQPGAEVGRRKSRVLVLHLHGSLCVRTSETRIVPKSGEVTGILELRDEPLFLFDPSSVTANFLPFGGFAGVDDLEDRIIAPLLDKSRGPKQEFLRQTCAKAETLLRKTELLVAIGYRFNKHDRESYQPLLRALEESRGRRLLVVSPDADAIADAIRATSSGILVESREMRFKEWVNASFPGV